MAMGAFSVDGLNYSTSGNDATITGATDSSIESLKIPATVTYNGKEYNVKIIGKNAFSSCRNLKEVIIEDSEFDLNGVWYTDSKTGTQVLSMPFENCPLEKMYIGRNTSTLIEYDSGNYHILNQVPLNNAGEGLTLEIGGNASQMNMTTISGAIIQELIIGGNVQRVYNDTFNMYRFQTELRKLTLKESDSPLIFDNSDELKNCPLDTVIFFRNPGQKNPFYNHKQMKHAIIGVDMTEKTCYGGESLASIRILSTCNSIPSQFSKNSDNIKSVIIEDSEDVLEIDYNQTSSVLDSLYLGRHTTQGSIQNLFRTKKLEVGEKITSLPRSFVYGMKDIENVILPETLETIGERAFYTCSGLKSIIIPENVSSIGVEAFLGCTSLKEFKWPANVSEIANGVLSGCSGLSGEMIIHSNICKIGGRAFYSCGFDRFIILDSDDPIEWEQLFFDGNSNIEYLYMGRQPKINSLSSSNLLGGNINILDFGVKVQDIINGISLSGSKVHHLIISEECKTIYGNTLFGSSITTLETVRCNATILPEVTSSVSRTAIHFTNAVLTVPIRTKAMYKSHETWGLWKNIRCDYYAADIDYDSDCGEVKLNGEANKSILVEEGSALTLSVIPENLFYVSSVEINGSSVNLNENGEYIIPAMNDDVSISVKFEKNSSTVLNTRKNDVEIMTDGNMLIINNCEPQQKVVVYDMCGRILLCRHGSFSEALGHGIYIVIIDDITKRIVL